MNAAVRKPVDDNVQIPQEKLLSYHELPLWRQDNPSILTGYRTETYSWIRCAKGLIIWHNESVNIWTHLLGAIATVIVVIVSYSQAGFLGKNSSSLDSAELALFLIGALVCFTCSTVFHSCACHSENVSSFMNRVDYLGILVLGTLNYMPTFYYAFYCDPTVRTIYSALMATSGAIGIYLICAPTYVSPAYRRMRTLTFIALGSVVVAPFIHALVNQGFHRLVHSIGLQWLFIEALAYILGATLYAERFPEALLPGKFDFVGASHQIFHVCSVIAVAVHYVSIWKSYEYWYSAAAGDLCI
ncbi:HlyIII-domain-containing protein [Dendrothele bispora CBS 962.96]|uniref:HlyIII-domain-containing protein n=1 Tax=Dendrothele bispora (strain CBS 962.96) TaxID=1314807 RepID=A0A4S8KQ75_DENBC|nr:HlyIII-domain-containing protein [Dendrothele bispora CBS 962.96]